MTVIFFRVEQLRVEDMIKRSFAEIDTQKKQAGYAEKAKTLKVQLEKMSDISSSIYEEATKLYTKISEYISLREAIWTLLLSLPIPGKSLAPGRLVILNHKGLTNILGIVLGVDLKAKQRTFQVLVCSNAESVTDPALENKALDDGRRDLFMGLVDQKIQVSDVMNNHHSLINLTDDKIIHITNKTIKIEPDKIINDIKKREIPRFKYDPPAQSVASALQQLS